MTNEKKASDIVIKILQNSSSLDYDRRRAKYMYDAAMEMAEWKDERVKSCFILISKLIKDSMLTKNNPECIMVEQMMELYNNLKM